MVAKTKSHRLGLGLRQSSGRQGTKPACRGPLATDRARKRNELLAATEASLAPIGVAVEAGRLLGADKIGLRVGRALNRYKMAMHFMLDIADDVLTYSRKTEAITAEAALDGIYVIRTNVGAETLDSAGVVETYKSLAEVERDFRSLKAIDLDLRPVYHHTSERVRSHVFICMLAAYLVWHLRRAWAPLCFSDEDRPARSDPVAPAYRSDAARAKASARKDTDGEPLHSFGSLLDHLATLTRDQIVFTNGARIQKLANATPTQRKAFELINTTVP